MEKFLKNIITVSVFFIISLLSLPFNSEAATLTFSPSTGTYKVGSSITVSVYVSSADKIMNAASGMISYPTDLLSVSSISKSGSLVDFWAQEPSFSNVSGSVNFEGVLLPPGYNSTNGKIITVVFKAKAPGLANISLSSGQVLAADGLGTDITSSLGTASFDIEVGTPSEPTILPTAEDTGVPQAPTITSITHPDSTKWYALSDASFAWGLPKDVTGSSVLIGRNSNSVPTVLYDPPISSKNVQNLADGIWYFHVQLKNGNGWGNVGHFKLQIDTEKPTKFDIREIPRQDLTDPHAQFIFDAVDKTSGIDHYEIQIDNNPTEIWKDDGSKIYKTPATIGGTHTLLVRAVDKAGNYLINSASFTVVSLEAPIITDYPTEIQSGDILIVKGISKYPDSQANLWLDVQKDDPISFSGKTDKDGKFSIVASDKLRDGLYSAWVEIVDGRGAKSMSSTKVSIVIRPSAIVRFGSLAVNILAILIPLLALLLILIFLLWYAWFRFFIFGKKIKKEVREAEDALHKAFDLLKESVQEQVRILEKVKNKRELTAEEERINNQLKKDLEDAEDYIRKEIEEIDELVEKPKVDKKKSVN